MDWTGGTRWWYTVRMKFGPAGAVCISLARSSRPAIPLQKVHSATERRAPLISPSSVVMLLSATGFSVPDFRCAPDMRRHHHGMAD